MLRVSWSYQVLLRMFKEGNKILREAKEIICIQSKQNIVQKVTTNVKHIFYVNNISEEEILFF